MKTIPAIIQVAHTEGIICVDPIANTPNTPCITHNTKLIADGVIEAIVQHKLNQAYIANILEMIQENAKTIETINEDTKRAIASEFNIFLQQKLSAYTTKDPVMQARIQLAR